MSKTGPNLLQSVNVAVDRAVAAQAHIEAAGGAASDNERLAEFIKALHALEALQRESQFLHLELHKVVKEAHGRPRLIPK